MNLPLTSIAWGMIQVALLCGTALVLAWIVGGRRPQVISAILGGCCLACLTLGALIWLPQTQWSVIPKSTSVANAVAFRTPATTENLDTSKLILKAAESASQSIEAKSGSSLEFSGGHRLSAWLLSHVQGFDRNVRSVEAAERLQPSGFSTRALMLFAVGAVLMGALWLYSWQYMRRILGNSQPLESQRIAEQVAEYAVKLKLRTMPQLRVSDQVPIGAMVGCFRHVLILHSSWSQWTQNELQAVLVHELAHAARRDFLWVVISSWVRILFFFHPLVQLVVRRLRLEQELAADQLAAGIMESANAYGRALASLALRSQNSTRAPSPMLSAEQVCIVRRITMLKHGSLMPRRTLMRWASCLTLATTLLSLPLSGLRGTPPEETDATDAKAKAALKSKDVVGTGNDEKQAAVNSLEQSKLFEAIEKKYPSLRFEGAMVWNPSRFQSAEISAGVRRAHYVYTVMALGDFPQAGQVFGTSDLRLSWSDFEREHGRFTFSSSVKQADQITPNLLSGFFALPELGPQTLSKSKKVIEGRVASEVVIQHKDPASDTLLERKVDSWIIDDEHGFAHGTEKEVAEIVRGEVDPFANVPEALLADYKSAAFATVFDCSDWSKKARDFYTGSPKQMEFSMVAPLLKGLVQAGIFLHGRESGDLRLRAIYVDEQTASHAKAMVEGLLVLGRSSLDQSMPESSKSDKEFEIFSELLKSARVELVGAELQVAIDLPDQFDIASPSERNKVPGWLGFVELGAVEDRLTLIEDANTVRIDGNPSGSLGGFLPQAIDAKAYCGKRVRLVGELGTHPDATDRAGLFLWSSAQLDKTLAFNSQSIDGQSNIPKQMTVKNRQDYLKDTEVKWSTTSIELDVPIDSQVLSFGAYTKNADLCVRNVKLDIIGDAVATTTVENPWLPYNLFVFPGHEIPSTPRNLDFSEPSESKSTDSAQVADRKTESVVR